MLEKIKTYLTHLLSGRDNTTPDLGRWSWMGSFIAIVGAAIWNKVSGAAVDLMQFAQALGVVVGAHGAALWAKRDTEPKP